QALALRSGRGRACLLGIVVVGVVVVIIIGMVRLDDVADVFGRVVAMIAYVEAMLVRGAHRCRCVIAGVVDPGAQMRAGGITVGAYVETMLVRGAERLLVGLGQHAAGAGLFGDEVGDGIDRIVDRRGLENQGERRKDRGAQRVVGLIIAALAFLGL